MSGAFISAVVLKRRIILHGDAGEGVLMRGAFGDDKIRCVKVSCLVMGDG
jgi:hypothetical protein